MTTVVSTNGVGSGNLANDVVRSAVHTRAQTLSGSRLALPLILSLPSRFAPSERLTVRAPPRALWLAGVFLRRKGNCAGVAETRTD